jgi:hypothetical protein
MHHRAIKLLAVTYLRQLQWLAASQADSNWQGPILAYVTDSY